MRMHEAVTVASMRVCNEDRSPVGIDSCDTAPTPTGFAESVRDYFPMSLHAALARIAQNYAVALSDFVRKGSFPHETRQNCLN
jgi:hypothetical protein